MRKISLTILEVGEIEELVSEDENENLVVDPPCDRQIDSCDLNHNADLPPMYVLTTELPENIVKVTCGHDDMDNWYFWWTNRPDLE